MIPRGLLLEFLAEYAETAVPYAVFIGDGADRILALGGRRIGDGVFCVTYEAGLIRTAYVAIAPAGYAELAQDATSAALLWCYEVLRGRVGGPERVLFHAIAELGYEVRRVEGGFTVDYADAAKALSLELGEPSELFSYALDVREPVRVALVPTSKGSAVVLAEARGSLSVSALGERYVIRGLTVYAVGLSSPREVDVREVIALTLQRWEPVLRYVAGYMLFLGRRLLGEDLAAAVELVRGLRFEDEDVRIHLYADGEVTSPIGEVALRRVGGSLLRFTVPSYRLRRTEGGVFAYEVCVGLPSFALDAVGLPPFPSCRWGVLWAVRGSEKARRIADALAII